MKHSLIPLALAVAAVSFTACNDNSDNLQASEVPASVMSSFNSKYNNVTDAEWEKEVRDGVTLYEVDFKADNKEIKALFDANGGLVESKGD